MQVIFGGPISPQRQYRTKIHGHETMKHDGTSRRRVVVVINPRSPPISDNATCARTHAHARSTHNTLTILHTWHGYTPKICSLSFLFVSMLPHKLPFPQPELPSGIQGKGPATRERIRRIPPNYYQNPFKQTNLILTTPQVIYS